MFFESIVLIQKTKMREQKFVFESNQTGIERDISQSWLRLIWNANSISTICLMIVDDDSVVAKSVYEQK